MQTIIGRHALHLASLDRAQRCHWPRAAAVRAAPPARMLRSSLRDPARRPSNAPRPRPAQTPTGNHAPTISGSPATSITSGQAYNFVPSAADADNDNLQFSIASKPSLGDVRRRHRSALGAPRAPTWARTRRSKSVSRTARSSRTLPQFAIDRERHRAHDAQRPHQLAAAAHQHRRQRAHRPEGLPDRLRYADRRVHRAAFR